MPTYRRLSYLFQAGNWATSLKTSSPIKDLHKAELTNPCKKVIYMLPKRCTSCPCKEQRYRPPPPPPRELCSIRLVRSGAKKLYSLPVSVSIAELPAPRKDTIHDLWKDLDYSRFLSLQQGDTKRCRLSLLNNSALVYESQCGGIEGVAVAGSKPMSTARKNLEIYLHI